MHLIFGEAELLNVGKAFLALTVGLLLSTPADAFERVGLKWCDRLLDHYDRCLRSVTYERCQKLTGGHDPLGCLAEAQALRREMAQSIRQWKIAHSTGQVAITYVQCSPYENPSVLVQGREWVDFCNGFKKVINHNMPLCVNKPACR